MNSFSTSPDPNRPRRIISSRGTYPAPEDFAHAFLTSSVILKMMQAYEACCVRLLRMLYSVGLASAALLFVTLVSLTALIATEVQP